MHLSANYYNPSWWREPRRLKNVIMTMEWVPDDSDPKGSAGFGKGSKAVAPTALSEEQLAKLSAAFRMVARRTEEGCSQREAEVLESDFANLLSCVGERIETVPGDGGMSHAEIERLFRIGACHCGPYASTHVRVPLASV